MPVQKKLDHLKGRLRFLICETDDNTANPDLSHLSEYLKGRKAALEEVLFMIKEELGG